MKYTYIRKLHLDHITSGDVCPCAARLNSIYTAILGDGQEHGKLIPQVEQSVGHYD